MDQAGGGPDGRFELRVNAPKLSNAQKQAAYRKRKLDNMSAEERADYDRVNRERTAGFREKQQQTEEGAKKLQGMREKHEKARNAKLGSNTAKKRWRKMKRKNTMRKLRKANREESANLQYDSDVSNSEASSIEDEGEENEEENEEEKENSSSKQSIWRVVNKVMGILSKDCPNAKAAILLAVWKSLASDQQLLLAKTAKFTEVSPKPEIHRSTVCRRAGTIRGLLQDLHASVQVVAVERVLSKLDDQTKFILRVTDTKGKVVRSLQSAVADLSQKKDNQSKAMRDTILYACAKDSSGRGLARFIGAGRHTTTRMTNLRHGGAIFLISLRQKPRSSALPDETRERVIEFYHEDGISRPLPTKNDVITITDPATGEKKLVPKRILENTLSKSYDRFKSKYPDVKIGQRSFECLRPRNVGFATLKHRLVCCCTYHVNLQYQVDVVRRLLLYSNRGANISVKNLVDLTLCDERTIECINRTCENCSVESLDDYLSGVKCKPSCTESDCSHCPIEWLAYELQERHGKSRVSLITKTANLSDFRASLKKRLYSFSRHQFMAGHMQSQYRNIGENLMPSEILTVMDYAENFAVLLPNEVQSIHWTTSQVTVFIIALTRVIDGSLSDEHYVFLSDDLKHDYFFVEHCKNLMIKSLPFRPVKCIEFCDGAAAQFKCAKAFSLLARSEQTHGVPTIRYFWETSHGKHKADGVGAVVKSSASMAVVRRDIVMRNADELYDFCQNDLSVVSSGKRTHMRKFFLVGHDDVDRTNVTIHATIPGTRSFHEVRSVNDNNRIMVRTTGCGCRECVDGNFAHCNNDELVDKLTVRKFSVLTEDEQEEANLSDDEEEDLSVLLPAPTRDLLAEGSTAIVRSDEELTPYYLVKVTKPPHTLESDVRDDYGYSYGTGKTVVGGHYFEEVAVGQRLYYLDKKIVYIECKCLLPLACRDLEEAGVKKVKGRIVDTFRLSMESHEDILGLVNQVSF